MERVCGLWLSGLWLWLWCIAVSGARVCIPSTLKQNWDRHTGIDKHIDRWIDVQTDKGRRTDRERTLTLTFRGASPANFFSCFPPGKKPGMYFHIYFRLGLLTSFCCWNQIYTTPHFCDLILFPCYSAEMIKGSEDTQVAQHCLASHPDSAWFPTHAHW